MTERNNKKKKKNITKSFPELQNLFLKFIQFQNNNLSNKRRIIIKTRPRKYIYRRRNKNHKVQSMQAKLKILCLFLLKKDLMKKLTSRYLILKYLRSMNYKYIHFHTGTMQQICLYTYHHMKETIACMQHFLCI